MFAGDALFIPYICNFKHFKSHTSSVDSEGIVLKVNEKFMAIITIVKKSLCLNIALFR